VLILVAILTFQIITLYDSYDSFAQESSPVKSAPYGISYPAWVAKWWQWIMPIPKANNPALDATGEKCDLNQMDQNVWFLATTFGGNIKRDCDIPEGRSILVPVLIGMCDNISEPKRKSGIELRDCAWSGIENAVYELTVDNVKFNNITQYRVETPVFNLTIPSDNAWGNPTGGKDIAEAKAVAVGVYVLLPPLSKGVHNVHFSSSIIDNPTLGTFLYAEDIEYDLNVASN
jgi:hypothetical protein